MRNKNIAAPLVIGVIVICLTVVSVFFIYSTEPVAKKDGATRSVAMLVEVLVAEVSQHNPTITAMGEVVPAQQIQIKPRVSGFVTEVSTNFLPGNIVTKGDWLIQLEQDDYQLALDRTNAEFIRAQSLYDIEMGEQEVAKKDFEGLQREVSKMNQSLILREPQRKQVEANLKAAAVAVKEAELDLQRTRIVMPFDGQIMTQDANVGSQLTPSDIIATVVGIDRYWIRASVPLNRLKYLSSPQPNTQTAQQQVLIRNDASWPSGYYRTGYLKEVIASLDSQTRMATVLVEVPDPLLMQSASTAEQPINQKNDTFAPLIAGSYVQVQLPAKKLNNVIKLPLSYLRKNNTVWLAADGKLKVNQVNVAFKDEQFAYINSGINSGAKIITTNLASVRPGLDVKVKEETDTQS